MRTTLGGAALLLAVAATTTACGGSSDDGTPPTTTTSSAAPSSTAPADPREQAKSDAQAMIKKYFEVTNEVGKNPKKPLNALKSVAVSSQLTILTNNQYGQWRKNGWRQTGDDRIVTMEVESVSLENSAPKKGKVPVVTVRVCDDVSKVGVVDRSGKSVVNQDRQSQYTNDYGVANYHWNADRRGGWRVAWVKNVPGVKSCGAH